MGIALFSVLFVFADNLGRDMFFRTIAGLSLSIRIGLLTAGITALGYGLPLDTPAMGVILAESMKRLSVDMWWPAFFPGLALLLVTQLFDRVGDT